MWQWYIILLFSFSLKVSNFVWIVMNSLDIV